MAKKKMNKSTTEERSNKVDLSNLFGAAKSGLDHFSEAGEAESLAGGSEAVSETATEGATEAVTEAGDETFSGTAGEAPAGAEWAEVFDDEKIAEIHSSLELFEAQADEGATVEEAIDEDAIDGEANNEEAKTVKVVAEQIIAEQTIKGQAVDEGELEAVGEGDDVPSENDDPQSEGDELSAFFDQAEENLETTDLSSELEGTELESFESVNIEELEFVEESQLESIIESVLFATDRPVSLASLKQIFKGTNVNHARLKRAIEALQVEYASSRRGVSLEEVGSGYQLRTKIDNVEFMRRSFKAKAFKLSGPALEVLAIVAYKQPVVKAEIDEIRGVESGHLLRALMEKNLVLFAGKSDLPGKPMQYATARKFLEIFGLRNLKELPTLSQIDELIPEGIGDEEDKPKLADITDDLSEKVGQSYSEGEEELTKITDQLEKIDTSSEFFEKEKQRQREERDAEKARNIREAVAVGESVSNRDLNWLRRYEEQQLQVEAQAQSVIDGEGPSANEDAAVAAGTPIILSSMDESDELEQALKAWDAEAAQEDATDDEELSIDTEDDSETDDGLFERMEANDIADIDEEVP